MGADNIKSDNKNRIFSRHSQLIGQHDLQIGAVALRRDLILVTHNTREFSRISTLRLEVAPDRRTAKGADASLSASE